MLPSPHSGLLAGIVLGVRNTIPQRFYNNLVQTGTLHVIAASGYNITIIAKLLIDFFARILKRRQAVVIAGIGIFMYAILAGMNAAVVRAAIMGLLSYIAQAFGRLYFLKF